MGCTGQGSQHLWMSERFEGAWDFVGRNIAHQILHPKSLRYYPFSVHDVLRVLSQGPLHLELLVEGLWSAV